MAQAPAPAAAVVADESSVAAVPAPRRMVAVTNPSAAKGSISWKVRKFSALAKSLKIGEKFTSPEFSTGNKKWSLHIYPQGRRDAWKDHIGIFLHYESEEPVVINFQISLLPASLQCTSGTLYSSNLKMEGHFKTGWDDFIGRAELAEFLAKDDTLSVECEVECLSDWRASLMPELDSSVADEVGCASDYAQLLTLSQEESFADFTFEVDGKVIHAHKAILAARSPVFRSMLATNMVESRSGRVKLDDVELPVFHAMLRYLYSGRIDEEFLALKCEEVLALADRYDVRKLKERCEALLSKAISTETVVNLLSLAETYHATSLKSIALLYAGQHFLELIHTDSFKELGLRTPALMVEIQESFAHYNGVRKRITTSGAPGTDEEPKKRQYRAPK